MLGSRLAWLCLSLPLVFACSSAEHHDPYERKLGPPPRKHVEQPIVVEPGPGVRDNGEITFAVQWFDGTLDEALAMATDQGKLVFVDVGAYWCPPCHELDEKVFTDRAVGDWLRERAIALHIDAEKGEGPELVERYRVQAYPTLLVLEPSGIEKDRIVDFHPSAEVLELLEAIAAGGNVLAERVAAVEAAPDDLAARFELGHAYALAAKRELAEAEFERVLAGDPDDAAGLASKVLYDRATFFTMKLDKDPEAAIAAFEQLQERYPASKSAVQAHRMIGRAHCKQGRTADAIAALERMIATDPADASLKASFGWFSFRENCGPEAGLAAVLAGIAQAPDDADLRYVEAELQRMLDAPELALAAIREAARLEPDSAYFKRQVRRFEALVEPEPQPAPGSTSSSG
jgi:thiol-disulfide isomerase/thioredoxin